MIAIPKAAWKTAKEACSQLSASSRRVLPTDIGDFEVCVEDGKKGVFSIQCSLGGVVLNWVNPSRSAARVGDAWLRHN